ncbi:MULTISPECIES: peptidoglycan D,D-transpeptidase FtsI family protein [unclassified Roseburia]|uniref:peptidoglycan D,D-transpeptidase FtsI family protein n=1 Tax=unclassified Roseburia TaxID=2637578 RepID=UPI000E54E1D9|nr:MULTISPECIES: penicillin-binding protein 2 [unclassified Roseburia]RHQ39678.1 penicillin-binding protein 2 [Roseburia sp. AF25-25LB]RHQ44803.1 penicillin-binding protein 2 [Roseburia sp. AF25-18LB]RHQ51974.1 penicillin-binding protein 2 [Roseburia sp. AF25-15LB]RHQ52136.1 penicillin-binding protein 2 [Roseburia sp. AF25-13LB]
MAGKRRGGKKIAKFSKKMQKKLVVLFVIIALLLLGLIVRLMYIEHTSGKKYEKKVLSQQKYDSTVIPYQRGNITDCKGTILATSVDVYNVILDCKVLNSDSADIDPTIDALITCFPQLNETDLRNLITDKPKSQYNVLAKKLSYEEIQAFEDMQAAEKEASDKKSSDAEKKGKINGVWFEKEYQREYPYGSLASAVVGFTTSGNLGMNGVENSYNSVLNGTNGREYGYLNSDSNFEKTVIDAQNGNDVTLTIDANIQKIVEDKIAAFEEEYRDAAREGAGSKHVGVIVMNPQNAEVLAMANYPNYDSSNPRDLSAYYTQEEIDAMDDDAELDALNQLWSNFCITYTYEPGSTVKPFTVACGLDTGTIDPNRTFICDGYETISGHDIHCVNTNGHGLETVEDALKNSCNDALMQMSYDIGPENFSKYQQIFGFGTKTNIDLPGEARTDSLIYTEDQLSTINLATNSFGQNFNVTMIQVASAFCSIINGGNYYQPHVVKKITDENGNVIQEDNGTLLKKTVSSSTSELLKQYLYATVSDGTGKYAKVPGYSMGGKTGTAQKLPRGQGNYLVSFIGFAPVDNPQLLVYVVVDEPNAEEEFHSTFAQEIAKGIFEETLPYLNIYPDKDIVVTEETDPAEAPTDGTTDVPDSAPEDSMVDQTPDIAEETVPPEDGLQPQDVAQ